MQTDKFCGAAMSEPNTEQKQCVHHWIIESPDGPTSFGICKHCGVVKEFSNDWQDVLIKRERPSNDHSLASDLTVS